MGSSLGPVLANVIMTELGKIFVKYLVDNSLIKVYMRYVDDTLLLVKERHIKLIHERLNSSDKNIKFTIDNFPDAIVHFLDIQIDKNHTIIYYKPAYTGQYTHFHGQTPWPIKTTWVKALFHRAKRICSTNSCCIHAFNEQIKNIKKLMSWNSYPKQACDLFLKRLNSNMNKTKEQTVDDLKKVWLNFPYLADKGDYL